MTIAQVLLPEFDQEMAKTRECLSRIPSDRLDWRAHEKSWSLQSVATHLANLPRWITMTIQEADFDLQPADGDATREEPITTVEEALEKLDTNAAAARTAIGTASDEDLMTAWTLLKGGQPLFTLPRIAVIRSTILNHMIHHRGQLTVYLRLNDVPVPALYGPSADEA